MARALKVAERRHRNNEAASPAISAVIITGTIVALVTVALAFASNLLVLKMAESEFNSAKQFMQSLGLEIDDVAWIIGRTETTRYSSMYGDIAFKQALKYTVYVDTETQLNQTFFTGTTGILCFNMPTTRYSVGNNYFDSIHPPSNIGFLSSGTSAPVAKVFAVEKLPMVDGSFARIVVMPSIRMLNLSIADTNYIRLYLSLLSEGETPRRYQSVTLTGNSVSKIQESVTGIRIKVDFPLSASGFDEFFFNFPKFEESISVETNVVLELFVGEIDVAFGMHA